jgi:flavin reductase (DIM6/NTAB) family NADH-FMN oxidoreductase RutF
MFATGITVVAADADAPQGMTANAFASVSLEPPLILVCVHRTAAMHAAIQQGQAFAVSVLSAGQEEVARHFANHGRPRGAGEFGVVAWAPGPRTGAPVVVGALAWVECRLAAVYGGGDHSIFLGDVVATGRGCDDDALLFFGGHYHRLPRQTAVLGRGQAERGDAMLGHA